MNSESLRPFLLALFLALALPSCTSTKPHEGRIPFRWMESPPRSSAVERLELVFSYDHLKDTDFEARATQLQPGDVLGFVMSHREAVGELVRGRVKKVPYEMFRYGHVSMVVPSPTSLPGDLRLLQVSILQPVTMDETLEKLRLQSWDVYRPPSGRVDLDRLGEFSATATERASDWKAYDFLGITGLRNADSAPESVAEIGDRYSCATLVVAALHYSGFELDAVKRTGWLDLVSPRQVLESRGVGGHGKGGPSAPRSLRESTAHHGLLKPNVPVR